MHLFGDPNFPRRNLSGGAILLALSSFLFGTTLEKLIWDHARPVDYVFLVLWPVILLGAIKVFRLGLASVPPDPDRRVNQPGLQ